MKIVP